MQEILTAITYLVAWFFCERVLGIENGLINLIISLSIAVAVYIIIAIRANRKKAHSDRN